MNLASILYEIQQSVDPDWLHEQRDLVRTNEVYSEDDRIELNNAIDERFSQLNAIALAKKQAT